MKVQDVLILYRIFTRHQNRTGGVIMEVGGAVNLYPVLAMLPFYDRVIITDITDANLHYLSSQISKLDKVWMQYIDVIRTFDLSLQGYDFQAELKKKVHYQRVSVFDLQTDIVNHISMNFLAESITDKYTTFYDACQCVKKAVRKGGQITATFMSGSTGYKVNGHRFPAVNISTEHVIDAFADMKEAFAVNIPMVGNPVRKGYSGIIYYQGKR
ncbi:MAG: NNMT/PNMT/TEMT family protein [Bacteroidetes bacterium ADurb.BinA104]|nr:MAG: NNMT/PNMT/TEMT family protein [Bacteroidetes bacterium ADurb.BinA104]